MPRLYEIGFLISPELNEEERKGLKKSLISFIQKEGGLTLEEGEEILKNLAYPIKKKTQAFFTFLSFQLKKESLPFLEKFLKEKKEILRYLIIKKELPKVEKPLPSKRKRPAKIKLEEIEEKLEEILK